MLYSRHSYLSLPQDPGVYVFLNASGDVLYVGKAKNLKSRVASYFTSSHLLEEKTRALVSQIEKIRTTVVGSELEALLLEAYYIQKYLPKYNIKLTDNKSYPYIRITNDPFPKVLWARRPDDQHSRYFGPYPSPRDLRLVLKTIRRIFPYQSVLNHPKRICLYHHLGLCPCPPVFDEATDKKEYRRNIAGIIAILQGKSRTVMRSLEKKREQLSRAERYEEAEAWQRKINALRIITEPRHQPFEYDVNPNLREDLRRSELTKLREILAENGLRIAYPERIECYDISNIQGTNATGSLVVLTKGEIDKSQYRKFKIRKDGKPNDFAMMQEMLERRLKHTEWPTPDLIVVDGGKGQLTSALKAMANADRYIPVVGLAKREETIIIPVEQENFDWELHSKNTNTKSHQSNPYYLPLYGANDEHFVAVSLPKNTPALQLVMRIRNEAHRFAITYHRKLRSKRMTSR